MALYSIAVATFANSTVRPANTVNAVATLLSTSTVVPVVFEIGTMLSAANATNHGIGHPGAGTTLGNAANGQPEDMSQANSTIQVGTTWSSYPTAPSNFFRRAAFPAVRGAGIVYTFVRGITLPVSNSLCIYNNNTASSNCDVWFCWDQ